MAQQQDPQLTAAEIAHLQAMAGAATAQSQTEAARTEIARQEQQTRAAAQQATQREGEAKIAQEQEMTPFQKLLSLSQAGAPALQEHANRVRSAIELYGALSQAKTAQDQIQSAQQIEAGRETGALQRQQETSKSNITDALITHLATRPDIVPTATMAKALRDRGSPELATQLETARAADVSQKVATNLAALPALVKTGNLQKALPSLQADPDVWAQLKPHVDEAMAQPGVQPSSAATLTGQAVKTLGVQSLQLPLLGPGALTAPVVPLVKGIANANWQKAAQDFYGGLTQ